MLEGRKRSREKVQDHEDSLREAQREKAVIGTEAGIQGREVGLENNTLMDIKGRRILPHHPHAHKAHTWKARVPGTCPPSQEGLSYT